MPAYLGTGKTPDAALWQSASSSTEISDEVLYDLRKLIGLFGGKYRLLRRMASSLDEINVEYSPEEIPKVIQEVEGLTLGEAPARLDTAQTFVVELQTLQGILQRAAEDKLYLVAHLEHHLHPADIQAAKKKRASQK